MAMTLDGPIPGENYTSNTKNYPWHRPPEHTDLDSAIEASFKKLMEDDNAFGLLTMLENGVTVAQATSMFVIAGIGAGKWTPDFAVLLAGPVAHIMYLLAKGYGVECELGIEKKSPMITSAFFSNAKKISESQAKKAIQNVDIEAVKEAAASKTGFMGMSREGPASMETQNMMLGHSDEVEEEEMY